MGQIIFQSTAGCYTSPCNFKKEIQEDTVIKELVEKKRELDEIKLNEDLKSLEKEIEESRSV